MAGLGAGARVALWKRVLPFGLAAGLLGVVALRTDFVAAKASLARVNVGAFVGFTAVFIAGLLAADALGTLVVYRRVIGPVRFRDLVVVRGASYLPSMLNHHVGQAFITVFLSRSHGVPLARVAGGTLIVYASWAACLLGVGMAAVLASGAPAGWLALPLATGIGYLGVLAARPRRLVEVEVLRPLFEAGVKGHLAAAVARIPHAIVLFLGTWLPMKLFGVDVPLGAALIYVPIVMVAVTLPITPQGFGTRELLATTLFAGYAAGADAAEREAAVAAATLSWGVVVTGLEAVLGVLLIRRAQRLLGARAGE